MCAVIVRGADAQNASPPARDVISHSVMNVRRLIRVVYISVPSAAERHMKRNVLSANRLLAPNVCTNAEIVVKHSAKLVQKQGGHVAVKWPISSKPSNLNRHKIHMNSFRTQAVIAQNLCQVKQHLQRRFVASTRRRPNCVRDGDINQCASDSQRVLLLATKYAHIV